MVKAGQATVKYVDRMDENDLRIQYPELKDQKNLNFGFEIELSFRKSGSNENVYILRKLPEI